MVDEAGGAGSQTMVLFIVPISCTGHKNSNFAQCYDIKDSWLGL